MRTVLALLLILLATAADAQQYRPNSTNLSGTIAGAGFQSIQVAQAGLRMGCTIQNNSSTSHNMDIFVGPIGSATVATSFILTPGNTFNCVAGNMVVQDQISIAGTASDTFTATFQ